MSHRATNDVVAFHDSVHGLCCERLNQAYNQVSQLFDRQLQDKRWSDTIGTEDITSTGICLIGLHRAGVAPDTINLRVQPTIAAMASALQRREYAGGLGLVVWANAVWGELAFDELLRQCGVDLSRPTDFVAPITTMETAWLLSGLVHERLRARNPKVQQAHDVVLAELLARYNTSTRLFRHSSERAPIRHRVRKNVANFADQIYSVQALAFASIAGAGGRALAVADGAAGRLVELQGTLGQWWWHYDPRTGGVADGFPVYSVHQHAMAPMALMALAAAGGFDHRDAVDLSHRWIRENELSTDLLDMSAGTIWRDIEPDESEMERIARHGRSVLGWTSSDPTRHVGPLKVNYETRPYEWAWCLYAGAIAAGQTREYHVV